MNTYTQTIAEGLKIDMQAAAKLQEFIEIWFDDFRWSSASTAQIIRAAKEAQEMSLDPIFA